MTLTTLVTNKLPIGVDYLCGNAGDTSFVTGPMVDEFQISSLLRTHSVAQRISMETVEREK